MIARDAMGASLGEHRYTFIGLGAVPDEVAGDQQLVDLGLPQRGERNLQRRLISVHIREQADPHYPGLPLWIR
jgi:hypothetical protein